MCQFDVNIAVKYGVNCAIIFQGIWDGVQFSRDCGWHYKDGRYWMVNEIREFRELFPFLGIRQISYAVRKLEEAGLIETGHYKMRGYEKYDKRLWYTVTAKGQSFLAENL